MNAVLQEILQIIILLAVRNVLSSDINDVDSNILEVGLDYGYKSIKDSVKELNTAPANNKNSLKYALYTPSNRKQACYIEPTAEEFDKCSFNPKYKTLFITHGFAVILKEGDQLKQLKDTLLDYGDYNIIIIDWTLYNNFPLVIAIYNIPRVGKKVAEMMHFIIDHTKADPHMFHCIGHSLGAHVCGQAARRVPNFHRVSGLDPGGITIVKLVIKDILLSYKDASYVDVIHTSFIQTGLGLGLIQPVGHKDFYVNGGIFQKHCVYGNEYQVFKGEVLEVGTFFDKNLCDHFISIDYYKNSVRDDCKFVGTKCGSFLNAVLTPVLRLCPSNSNITDKMGFHSEKMPEFPPKTVFYVEVLEFDPYCKDRK